MIRRIACALLAAALATPLVAAAETWSNVALVDQGCATKEKVAANPDSHTRDCGLQCAKNGFGVFTADGKYLKLDADGSKKALDALKASAQKDHLRVNVTGTLADGVVHVQTLEMAH